MQQLRLIHLLFFVLLGFEANASEPIVTTQNGDVRGVGQGQVESFKALPFAAPPTGLYRWKPPRDPANWTGIRDASAFSSKCPQMRHDDGVFIGDENCLYLNVFKPADARALPVVVFIHGGSLITGSASQTGANLTVQYDGSQLAKNANVVVVTLNYRLGPLGHMAHRQLSLESPYKGSGNYAYMDQYQALKWVQRNIAAFGGDPGNVTLFGQSAGATSVWVHIASPLSAGLFHRAIVDSGIKESAKDLSVAEGIGTEFSRKLGCLAEADELACMRSKSAEDIIANLPNVPGLDKYGAIKDQWVLKDDPIRVMRRGEHNHVPIIQGNVREELARAYDIVTEAQLEAALTLWYKNIAPYNEILLHYPASDYQSPSSTFQAIFQAIESDSRFFCPSRRILRALSSTQKDFIGRFFYTHTYSDGPYVAKGAFHGFELLFIFNTLGSALVDPTRDEVALVKKFQDAWSAFAKTGSPPAYWKKYDPQNDNYVVFDGEITDGDHLRQKQCDFWDKLPPP